MTPKQRVGALLAGQPIDRVVVVPLILNHAARVLGVRVSEYARDGEVMGRAQVAAYRRYGQDLITIFTDTGFVAEAMGTKLAFPADDVSRFQAPAVAEAADVAKLGTVDPRGAGGSESF